MSHKKSARPQGRPATGQIPNRSIRLFPETLRRIQAWRRSSGRVMNDSEAIRHLIEVGLQTVEAESR